MQIIRCEKNNAKPGQKVKKSENPAPLNAIGEGRVRGVKSFNGEITDKRKGKNSENPIDNKYVRYFVIKNDGNASRGGYDAQQGGVGLLVQDFNKLSADI